MCQVSLDFLIFIKRNASFGMISVLTGLTPSEWACDEEAFETSSGTCREIMAEIMALGRALGYDESLIPSNAPDIILADARVKLRNTDFVPSALLDVRRKTPFELEVILGRVYRQAKVCQVSTPVCILSCQLSVAEKEASWLTLFTRFSQ